MRVLLVLAAGVGLVLASCGSDSDSSSSSSSGSSGGDDGGTTSSTSSSGGSSSGGDGGDGGGGPACAVRYCCSFDGTVADCAVDRADLQALAIDPKWITQTMPASPPNAMRLDAPGNNPVLNDFGLKVLPKLSAGKRVEAEVNIRMETAATAGIFLAKGGSEAFALVAAGGNLQIIDAALNIVGPLPQNAWTKVTVFVDPVAKTYGASVPGGVVVTRNMASPWTEVTELRFGLTRTDDTTAVNYDDVRVDWK